MNARDELADILMSDALMFSDQHYGRDYALAEADAIFAAGYRKPRTITTAEELDEVEDGTIARGVTDGRSFYTLQFNDDGFWNQMGCDDQWEHESLFPFFDHLEILYEPEPRS
jgi:hypothetical protein